MNSIATGIPTGGNPEGVWLVRLDYFNLQSSIWLAPTDSNERLCGGGRREGGGAVERGRGGGGGGGGREKEGERGGEGVK